MLNSESEFTSNHLVAKTSGSDFSKIMVYPAPARTGREREC